MITKKTFEFGEYVVKIYHNDSLGEIRIEVLDENLTLLESIHLNNAEDDDNSNRINFY